MDKFEMSGFFEILDYRLSHRLLLIRSTNIVNETPVNTDIIFVEVYFLEVPTCFENISIELANEAEYNYVQSKHCFPVVQQYDKVFKIKTNNKEYFIGCWEYRIETNNLLPLETSITM